MEFETVIRRRRMVRNFDGRPLPPGTVQRLVRNAQRGPSAGFSQGVELLVLEGRTETARYWDAALLPDDRDGLSWPGLLRAPLLLVFFAHKQAYLDRYAEPDKGWTDRDEAHWPVPYWTVDTAFAAMVVLLTAVDAGLGALFFGVFHRDEVCAAFGVPAGYDPVGTVAVGYPADADEQPSSSARRGRRPAADVIHRGHWVNP